jgi:tetratricopeptide (TPR) repeat protein/O-antigen ligase
MLSLLSYPLVSRWAGLGLLLALVLARTWLLGRAFPASPLNLPLGLYLVGALVGLQFSLLPHTGEVRLFGLLAALVGFMLIIDLTTSAGAAGRLVTASLLLMGAAAPILVLLLSTNIDPDRTFLPYSDRVVGWLEATRPLAEVVQSIDAIGQRFRLARSGIAVWAAVAIGLALGPLLAGVSGRWRILLPAAIGYFGCLLLLVGQRGHLISVLVVVLLFGALAVRPRLPRLAAGILVGTVVLVVASMYFRQTLATDGAEWGWILTTYTLSQRVEYWRNALYLLADFRFTGVGLGLDSVGAVYDAYFPPVGYRFFHTHNIFIQSLLEQGPLGLIGLVGLVITGAALAWRTLARAGDSAARSVAISGAAAGLVLVLCGLTDIDAVTSVGMVGLLGAAALLVVAERLDAPCREVEASAYVPWRPRVPAARLELVRIGAPIVVGVIGLGLVFGVELLRTVGAQLYLNLGSIELARASLVPRERDDPATDEHLARAYALLMQAREWTPGEIGVSRNLASLAIAANEPARGKDILLEAEPPVAADDAYTWYQFGRLYRQAEDPERALAAWSHVGRPIGHFNRQGADAQLVRWAVELLKAGRPGEAVTVSLGSIRASPDYPEPYAILSVALGEQRAGATALRTMEELTETYPEVPWAYQERGKLADRSGQRSEAVLWGRRASAVFRSASWTERSQRARAERPYSVRLSHPTEYVREPLGPSTLHHFGPIQVWVLSGRGARTLIVRNSDAQPYDLELGMSYQQSEEVFATATANVGDLQPGQTRVVILEPSQQLPLRREFSYSLQVARFAGQKGSRQAEIARRIRFGEMRFLPNLGFDVEVRNEGSETSSLRLQALVFRGGGLVNFGTGRVTDLAPGQMKVATLLTSEVPQGYDEVVFAVDRLLE